MSAKLAEITDATQTLSTDEKLALVAQLVADALSEIPDPHEAAWQSEVQRRREEVFSGRVRLIPDHEVERSLDRLLG
jgi:Putative addiction module component